MLSMHSLVQRSRQLLLAILFILCVAWVFGEGAQWLLRWRAEKLLADIRTLQVNRGTWSDAQQLMQKWAQWTTAKPGCTADTCTVQISLVQTLPPILVASPDPGAHNWLPRLADHIGLRSAAARAGFTVEHDIVTSKFFGEQTTPPVRDLGAFEGYIPYLSVSSAETSHFREIVGDTRLPHPNRMAQYLKDYLQISFSPEEDPAEQSALMDFRFPCLTQLRPCETEAEILPEGALMLQQH
jgi:hypothetical protein